MRVTVHLEIFPQPSQIVILLPMWKGKAAASSIEQTQTNPALSQRGSFLSPESTQDMSWKVTVKDKLFIQSTLKFYPRFGFFVIVLS